jgi:Protein of unknown function (DUF1549)/Protein of unknown function (DUF1553)
MTSSAGRWVRWCRRTAVGLALAPFVGLAAGAVEAVLQGRDEFVRAREITEALQKLQASLDADPARGTGQLPQRPAKVIHPPELDSAQVDALFDRLHEAAHTQASPLIGDETFVRRVYLDVAGRLPTPDQIEHFCADSATDKRARLIDVLLASPDYAENWARYWRDVFQFHASNTNPIQVRFPVLEDWLVAELARNAPWDEVATALITAVGRNDTSGPANFLMAHSAEPVELAGEVSRVFMGVQIQCAQCHDHPTDPWTRKQFHEFAAFFAGLRQPRRVVPGEGQLPVFEVTVQRFPRYTMPDLKDPQTQIPVPARFFLASTEPPLASGLTTDQRRALAASFVTGQDNLWFAKAFVNRIWYALIGTGFYNPVDDLGPTRSAVAPEVLEAVASQWQQGGYDVHWLFRTILNTKTYQREVRSLGSPNQALFASSCPVRLRSDQLLDALTQALDLPLDTPPGGPGMGPGRGQGGADPLAVLYRRRLFNPRVQFGVLFGVDPSTPNEDVLGTIPQALYLMNSPQLNRAIDGSAKQTVLGQILAGTDDDRDALEALYLRVLARRPGVAEVEVCSDYLATVGNRTEAFEDIFWNLINSTEFISRR